MLLLTAVPTRELTFIYSHTVSRCELHHADTMAGKIPGNGLHGFNTLRSRSSHHSRVFAND